MNCQKNTGSNYLWYYKCKGTTINSIFKIIKFKIVVFVVFLCTFAEK